MNTSGSEKLPLKRRPAGFLETLGDFASDPRTALRRVLARPEPSQAALIVVLAALARLAAETTAQGLRPAPLAARAALSALALWIGAAALWHGISRLFGRDGEFRSLLSALGWSTAVYALALPVGLAARWAAMPALALGLWSLALELAFLALAWWSLREVYGWSGGKALLVLAAPPAALLAVAATIGAFFAASFLGGAMFSRIFL